MKRGSVGYLTLLLPLVGCSAVAQDASNSVVYNAAEVSLDNFVVDIGPRLTVDDKLKAMGPEGWHRIALYANWDFTDDAVWRWIAAQPDCDKGTALAIFWKSTPDYYLQYASRNDVPETERAEYDLVIAIRDRWLAGGYTRAQLAFDPVEELLAPDSFAELEQRHGDRVAKLIPPSMRVALKGKHIANVGEPLPGVYGDEAAENAM